MNEQLRNLIETRVGAGKATSGDELATILLALLETSAATTFPDVATLLATDRVYDEGTYLFAQAELITYVVVGEDLNSPQIGLASGNTVLPVPGSGGLDARATGIVADGVTDDTDALQLAIDIALYSSEAPTRVLLPAGIIRVTRPIHVGYGDGGFGTVPLIGHGNSYGRGAAIVQAGTTVYEELIQPFPGGGLVAQTPHAGTIVFADHTDGPGINIQGARNALLQDIYVRGVGRDHIAALSLDAAATDKAAWLWPGLPALADSRYAPYAGITVDAYAGPRPAQSYGDVAYPAWGGTDQYNRTASSSVRLINVAVEGFVVGIANQPCDFDGNADFLTVRDCRLFNNVYALSICNTQSRNVAIEDCEIHRAWVALTNNTHGGQRGRFGGPVDNLALSNVMNICQIGSSAFGGPITFLNIYAESTWRLGSFSADTSNELSAIFINPRLNLGGLHDDAIGVPATLMDTARQPVSIRFESGYVETRNMAVFNSDQVRFNETHTDAAARRIDGVSPGLAAAHNLAGNVIFGPAGVSERGSVIQAQVFDAQGDRSNTPFRTHMANSTLDTAVRFQDSTVFGLTLTNANIVAGDVLIDPQTMTVFIASVDGAAEAQNNYRNGTFVTPLPTSGSLNRRQAAA